MKLFVVLIALVLSSSSLCQQTTEEVDIDIEAAIIQLEKDMLALNKDIDELSDDSEKIKEKLYAVESDVSYAQLEENNINKLVKALGDIFNTVAQQVEEVQKEFDETDKTLKKVQATVREFINQKIDLKIDDAHSQAVRELGYSFEDTNFLITASTDGQVNFWQNGNFGGSLLEIDGPVTSFAVTSKNILVTGSNLGRSVAVYDENYQLIKKIGDKVDGLFKVIVDPDNADQVIIGSNKKIVVVNVDTNDTLSVIESDISGPINAMALDLDDGELFTTCLFENDIYAWNRADGTLKQKLTGHTRPVEALALDRRERLLASSSQDGKILIWDPLTLQLVREYTEHTDSTLALVARDGILYSASQDKTIKIWNLESPSTSSIITYTYTGRGHPTSLAINFKDQLVVGSSFGDVQYLSIKKLSINY